MWRRAISALILPAICKALVACGQVQSAMKVDSTPNTQNAKGGAMGDEEAPGGALKFRITWKGYSGRGEAIQAIVDAYNEAAGDGSAVTLVNGDEDRAAIEELLVSEQETVYVLPYRFVKYFGDKGYLMDLTDAFAEERDLFYEQVWALGTVDGKTYGIPWLGHSMCLLYNERLLEKAGVQAESINSMDDLLKAIDRVEEATGAGGLGLVGADSNDVSWMVNQFLYGFGSSLVSADGRTVTVNNEKSVEALKLYRDVLGPRAQPSWVDDTVVEVMKCFREQEIAFEILGIWGVTDIERNGAPFEVGILPLKNIGLCSEVGPMMLAMPKGMSEQGRRAALDFIRYMISRSAQEEIMKGEYSPERDAYYPFRTPIRRDMVDSAIFQSHPEYRAFIEGFENPSVDVPVPAWQAVKEEVYEPGLHEVMSGKMAIEEFLMDVEKRGNEILAQ
jgi:multiple sugar transport system substrate-binding protein